MTTETLIANLKELHPVGPLTNSLVTLAALRLEELQRDLVRLRRTTTRPEPSRLEIAAMLIAGSYACQDINPLEANIALKQADKLIAAAKEAE
jgi:hypothetical protein